MSFLFYTGNPFVDLGVATIVNFAEVSKPSEVTKEHIVDMGDLVKRLYIIPVWQKANYTNFVNYPTNNPSNKGNEKEKLREFIDELLNNVKELKAEGNCLSCGRREVVTKKNRMHFPLIGSGASRNMFSFANEGADFCDVCTFAAQCAPIAFYTCGGKMLAIHSNSHKLLEVWAAKGLKNARSQAAVGSGDGPLNEGYANPINSFFHIAEDLILQYEERWQYHSTSIRLYSFTNYIQGPELEFYDLPSPLFRFLWIANLSRFRSEWKSIVRRGYRKIEDKTEDEYKNYQNSVYIRLLNNQSILGYFYDRRKKLSYGTWELISEYVTEVRKMDQKRTDAIRTLGDTLADFFQHSERGKKRLAQLEQASSYNFLRNIFLRITRDRMSQDQHPLFSFDDYVEKLFPNGYQDWREVHDLLMFRVYEKLHDWIVQEGLVSEEEEEIEETTQE